MKQPGTLHLPSELLKAEKKSIKLEYITLIYLATVVVLMYLVMGNSQAMKTAWLEDALSLIPAILYLIAVRHYRKPPNRKFPYGYQRNFSIAFLAGSVALLGMGLYLMVDSSMALINAERPTLGSMYIFGKQVWVGWLMILVLIYSSVPAMILGFKKLPLAKKLHNKILLTDADTQKADYMTSFAAMIGILGVGIGWWWADSATAVFISLSVIKDGFKDLQNAVFDLMDRRPENIDGSGEDELIDKIQHFLTKLPWVKSAAVRFRECGQIYIGEVYVTPHDPFLSPTKIENAVAEIEGLDWKIVDVTLMVVNELPMYLETNK